METALIQSWARLPGGDLSDAALQSNAWIRGWFARQSGGTLALFATGFVLTLANLICLYRSRSDHAERAIFLLYVPTIAALAFWFLTAPDVRFLGAALVLFFLLSGYLAAAQLEPQVRLGKVNTEEEQGLAARFGIRSIPTLVLIRHGRELARQAGAMGADDIRRWTLNNLG